MIKLLKQIFSKAYNQDNETAERSLESFNEKFKISWDYNLLDLLKKARLGDVGYLKQFLSVYSPLAVVNEDYTVLLLFRYFHADFEQEISVLNCHPQNEDFQCGITITSSSEHGASQTNILLPNNYDYKGLKIINKEIEIITSQRTIKTNVTELFQKLNFWTKFTRDDIESAFNRLCREQSESVEKYEVLYEKINVASIGELVYNDKYDWYECQLEIEGKKIELNINLPAPAKLDMLIDFVDMQMKSMFFKEALLKMEVEMISNKNEYWLDLDIDTGEVELPITVEKFRELISMESIVFYEDCSSTIYCVDNNVFGGHTIAINVDEKGNYIESNLAG